ncbi:hypothetical protein HYH03_010961 [Edaphochlamys debaryana]|uniref:Uncharacterized protein n=1 Tax=Edaphochlamys debaryana TaxID=47281 RepID=A0A835XVV6_9CHLO|nr:hypothetical protein HYH03_010961 [Edaphochlamys debaryana]|eukprot:KAG2490567.1 hypothetical protein HYH03_010961 [Edaphochlamys debaryana]
MAGGGTRSSSRSRATAHKATGGCVQCQTACCCCCKNWCHVCGVRKCRAQRDSVWAPGTTSEYIAEFPPKQVPLGPRRPGDPLLPSGRFYGKTTNRADFTPKRADLTNPRPREAGMPARPFDGDTTYHAHFPPKRADLEDPLRKIDPAYSAPFVGLTTYNTEYIPRQVRPWTAQPGGTLVSVPFEGNSEYLDQYTKKPIPPPRLPPGDPLLPSNHVPTITTYGHDYIPLPFDKRQAIICCDNPRHPAEHVRITCCVERPWTTCSSCVNSRPGTGGKGAGGPGSPMAPKTPLRGGGTPRAG